ncbi:hypothetical protein HMPREF9123_0559 [Neisseria bacilliformis ATCC BAA-1200]|uniref:Uncharacterized protein n=1 Tax=Neisseria bacilliformis ATCC BAA-1200 TaxID=888742 RepID=F2BA32_9NEIS|nr:hypothetical protein HMPREF9123_0559 [Neisseria bacilliformis ATCC BAA-1200]
MIFRFQAASLWMFRRHQRQPENRILKHGCRLKSRSGIDARQAPAN